MTSEGAAVKLASYHNRRCLESRRDPERGKRERREENVSEARSTSVMLTVRLTDDGEGKMRTWDCTFDQFILSFFLSEQMSIEGKAYFLSSPSPSLPWQWQLMGQINHASFRLVSLQHVFVSERDGEKENKYTWLYWLQIWRTQIQFYRYSLPKMKMTPWFSHVI